MHILKFIYSLLLCACIVINASNYSDYSEDEGLVTKWYDLKKNPHSTELKKDIRRHWVLSLDGDGLQGILNLFGLVSLEYLTKKSVIELFDGIVATSFSGVIACLLTLPDPNNPSRPKYSAQDALNILTDRMDEMFVPNYFSFGGVFGSHYRTAPFKDLLNDIFGENNYKDRLLPTALVMHDLNSCQSRAFATTDSRDFYTKDLAMASAAFPNSYEPQKVTPIGSEEVYFLRDGCAAMNNPTVVGVDLLQKHYKVGYEDIHVLSLGRKGDIHLLNDENLSRIEKLTNLWINSQESVADEAASSFLKERYYRFNTYLGMTRFIGIEALELDVDTQNILCDFEEIARILKNLSDVNGIDKELERSKGRVVKRSKLSSRGCGHFCF